MVKKTKSPVKKQVKPAVLPRGLRNNNPLNIRQGNVWLGERPHPTDTQFEEFITIHFGLRAACILLRRYIKHYGANTVPAIISRWAPASENQTTKYIDSVLAAMDIAAEDVLVYENQQQIVSLVKAMGKVECGVTLSDADIIKGYKMA